MANNISMLSIKDTSSIKNPIVKAIAEQMLSVVKISTEKAYAAAIRPNEFKLPADRNSLEQVLSRNLQRKSADKRASMANKALSLAKRPVAERIRDYGQQLGQINLASPNSVATELRKLPVAAEIKTSVEYLNSISRKLNTHVIVPQYVVVNPVFVNPNIFRAQQAKDELEFRLHQVLCVRETQPIAGSDEIALGGMAIDAEMNTIPIPEQFVGNFSDSGVAKNYLPPQQFFSPKINLRAGNAWPKEYIVTMIMAEKDGSGFSRFLADLWSSLKTEIITAVATAVGAASGAALGSIIPGVGSLIGAAVGAVIGAFVGWLTKTFEDDIFEPVSVAIVIPSLGHLWDGRAESSTQYATFTGHGGEYQLAYDWRRTFEAPPPQLQTRRLTGKAIMYAMDHENFGRNPQKTVEHNINLPLTALGTNYALNLPYLGVGGEVRLEVRVAATLLDVSSGRVRVYGELLLFEGDSESSNDLDGRQPVDFTLVPNESRLVTVVVRNTDEGGDVGEVKFELTNSI
ncbi:hypothetical protein [uncultured Thiothrix sp.]|uniref:hypothetical protein n=1 Tax=uncultured Thiothrix sp. TaxID=223185 RepID=UPI0026032B54|nr:hypothetical protein [uncultured Thiothrix sp.]HMT94825.1 hypothetical protein [Thiolinea sp.]